METKIDLLLKAANVIETNNYNKVCSNSWSENKKLYIANPHTRISKINNLMLKRGIVSKQYISQLNEIILGFNEDLHFLEQNPLEVAYIDQLVEIGILIKNLTFLDNYKLKNYNIKGMKQYSRKTSVRDKQTNELYFNKKSH